MDMKRWIMTLKRTRQCGYSAEDRAAIAKLRKGVMVVLVIFLGLQNFRGDVPYDWYQCNSCHGESVYANNRLIKVSAERPQRSITKSPDF